MRVTAELVNDTHRVKEKCDLELIVRSSEALTPGAVIEVQFPNSWLLKSGPSFTRELQSADPSMEHYVSVGADGAAFDLQIRPRQLNFHQGKSRHGRVIVATLKDGQVKAGASIRVRYANTFAPYVSERETIHVSINGVTADPLPPIVTTPGPAVRMRVIAPSWARVGQAVSVLVVSLDEFDNCSCTRYEGQSLVRSDGVVAAERLDFTGSVRVPVTIQTEGVFRFSLGGVVSNAVRVGDAPAVFWGDLHIHTKLSSDGMGNDPYGYARNVSGLDFAAAADHRESLGEGGYRQAIEWLKDANRPGEFATIPADERNPAAFGGHHNLYFRNLREFIAYRSLAEDSPLPPDPSQAMLVPHHTGINWGAFHENNRGEAIDLAACDDRGMRPVMEIYSHHGQSECYAPQHVLSYGFNRMRNPERRSNSMVPGPFYAQDYWMSGRRLGVIGSSDEHSGQGGRRHGGLAAVWAQELTREGIFDAIRQRRCYATTGERILVDFSVDRAPMGQEINRPAGSKLEIELGVWGTDLLLCVEILRFRFGIDGMFKPILSISPRPESTDYTCRLEDEIVADAIYYARVTQHPLDWPAMAWTSPVWVSLPKE